MRLFVAIEIPEALRSEVAAALASPRRRLPPARWVAPQNLHLTLAFLGETEEALLPRLGAALAPAFASHRPFRLRLGGGGTFPPRRPARVAWVGVEEAESLLRLQADVAAALRSVEGIGLDQRPFHAHLTVGRCRRPWGREAVEFWRSSIPSPLGESFPVEQGALMESRLGPQGARYLRISEFPLEGTD